MADDVRVEIIRSKAEWNEVLSACNNVSLLQAWEYGEAKQKVEGWTTIRSVLLDKNRPIAATQILTKKFPILGEIARINRGPVLLAAGSESDIDLSLRTLLFFHYHWVQQKQMALFIAPNIFDGQSYLRKLQEIGYVRTNTEPWSSIIIDLFADEATLRKNLRQKWRNLLNKSEKMGLKLEMDNSQEGFQFLMGKYKQVMAKKGFSGPSERLIREVRDATTDKSSIQVMFAVKDGIKVSGILILGYVDTCHYFVGWNSFEGRQLQANYFLLWQALLLFKKMGYHWFDLGGISKTNAAGIAHFKRGLGGREYTLIGEFEACPKGISSVVLKGIVGLARRFRKI
jgi:lipid II:glycine glycyltransferase (peptidoglycan interpeptide bridge formation enzyme)